MNSIKINFIKDGETYKVMYCTFIPRVNEFIRFECDEVFTVKAVEYNPIVNDAHVKTRDIKQSFINIEIA